jgi:hypothetical protein
MYEEGDMTTTLNTAWRMKLYIDELLATTDLSDSQIVERLEKALPSISMSDLVAIRRYELDQQQGFKAAQEVMDGH